MRTLTITRAEPQPQRLKLAYVKHNFERYGFPNLTYFPDVIQMMERPGTSQKGRNIHVRENWWRYIEKIQPSEASFMYTRSVQNMWINVQSDWYVPEDRYTLGLAESVTCGGNFVSWDLETSTHVRLISFPHDYDTTKLNPAIHNWHNMPHMFWKACAVERFGTRIINVAGGLDVYFPLICNTPTHVNAAELWMRKMDLILLPEDYYTFRDGSVYKDGELFYHHGVIPPK